MGRGHYSLSLLGALLGASGAVAQTPSKSYAALQDAVPGLWQLKSHDRGTPGLQLCVADVRILLQIRHRALVCPVSLIKEGDRATQVHYSCAGLGYGDTRIRAVSAHELIIDTQGEIGHEPFADMYDAERVGDCAAASGHTRPR